LKGQNKLSPASAPTLRLYDSYAAENFYRRGAKAQRRRRESKQYLANFLHLVPFSHP